MNKRNSKPEDLALLVHRKLKGTKVKYSIPKIHILNRMFETLFYASLKTEESELIEVTVTLIDSKKPDPKPPGRIVKDRWNFIYFEEKVEFNVKNIVKLSKAADPWSSSLAVDFDENDELFIWGLIDQAVHYQSYLHHESESGPEQPGLFQTSINGIGNLVIIFDYELIATLKQNVLISNYIDVFNKGYICNLLRAHNNDLKKEIKMFMKELPDGEIEFWARLIDNYWTETLSRILIRIKNYKHGGAFLISEITGKDLDVKHKINYERLFNSIKNLAKKRLLNYSYSNIIHNDYMEEELDEMPILLYLKESVSDNDIAELRDELKGAVRFVSSLSCIDGLIVMNSELKVKGFGAVIKNIELPDYIYLSKSSTINVDNLVKISPDHFGTRHRSMFSYCWKHDGSIGFVISQDGDIRAITKVDTKLIMWENIRVQKLITCQKLKRPTTVSSTKTY